MDHLAIDEETHQALTDYKSTLAQTTDAETAFRLAEAAAAKMIGHQLFTVMAFHADTMEVERCYSSNPDKYPTGGAKAETQHRMGASRS